MVYRRKRSRYGTRRRLRRSYRRTRRPRYRRRVYRTRRRYGRMGRTRRKPKMSVRFGQQYHKSFFRTPVSDWFTIPANSSKGVSVGFGSDTLTQPSIWTLFTNLMLQYEKVKFESYSWHYYFKHESAEYRLNQGRIELYKKYDSDDTRVVSKESQVNDDPNTKFHRLRYQGHYQLKIKPRYRTAVARPKESTSELTYYKGGKGIQPWWDTDDINSAADMTNFPKACNGWKLYFNNPGEFPVTVRAYRTLFCTFKDYVRQTHQPAETDPKPGPAQTNSYELI